MIVIPASSLQFPSTSAELFGRDAPLVMEIGVGSGGFIEDLSRSHPDLNVLGVDRAPQSIARSFRRMRRAGLEHVRVYKGDAAWLVRNVISPGGLQRVYLNFPDPWPRERHHSRRLLKESFLRLLSSRLARDGDVLVTTDHSGYFEFVLRSAEKSGCFVGDVMPPPQEVAATKWAGKAATHLHVVLRPSGPPVECKPEMERTEVMYHAVVRGDLPDLSPFENLTFRYRHGVVVLMDAYRPLDGRGYVFLVHVEEVGLSQEVLVDVHEGREDFVVSLRRFGEPLHTSGLSEAVRLITEWLAAQGMTIIHKKF